MLCCNQARRASLEHKSLAATARRWMLSAVREVMGEDEPEELSKAATAAENGAADAKVCRK